MLTPCDETNTCPFTYGEPFELLPENALAVEVYFRVRDLSQDTIYTWPGKQDKVSYRWEPGVDALYAVINNLPSSLCSTAFAKDRLAEKVLVLHREEIAQLRRDHG